MIKVIPSAVAKNTSKLIFPRAARKKPPATVIRLPKIIPGLVTEKNLLIKRLTPYSFSDPSYYNQDST